MITTMTRLLVLIYGLTTVSNSVMDLGHELLHNIRNSIHHHDHDEHHHLHDHHITLKTAIHDETADSETDTVIYSYFLYFETSPHLALGINRINTYPLCSAYLKTHWGYVTPLTPPPLCYAIHG